MGRPPNKPMDLIEREFVYSEAIKLWGKPLQSVMCIEEMAELTKVITKRLREDFPESIGSYDALCEEIADVEVMLEQLTFMHGAYGDVRDWKKKKISRLKKMMEGKG